MPNKLLKRSMVCKLFKKSKRRIINVVMERRFGRFKKEVVEKILSPVVTTELIAEWLVSKEPFFVGRLGSGECDICWNYARASFLSKNHNDMKYVSAHQHQGISTSGDPYLDRFASIYIAAIPHADLIAIWELRGIYAMLCKFGAPDLQITQLETLGPPFPLTRDGHPWPRFLAGKRVLVVHPFARSIQMQYARRSKVKSICDLLPDFELLTIVPPVTFAGQDNGRTWVANLQSLMSEVAKQQFDVALIGCGAYGFPLGAFVKQMGRQAIHFGGATQILFGIRGKRWDEREAFSSAFMDDTWVRPLEDERPIDPNTVESGCYW